MVETRRRQWAGHGTSEGTPFAAEYLRMSTENQKYSIDNQAVAIRAYAAERGLEIIETYVDAGRSGLTIRGRPGLQRLIHDVQSGHMRYGRILVFDVSRWGRFQDIDESAYYEFMCRLAGIRIEYCAEPFDNDGSPAAVIFKGLKRVMAGEFSRELSMKTFLGQCRAFERGFHRGGAVGFGLRRILIDKNGQVRGELERGEHKYLVSDRILLRPGPPAEIEIVRAIYRMYVEDRTKPPKIAEILNGHGLSNSFGRPWQADTVSEVLRNEKYIGNVTFNKETRRLRGATTKNPPEAWLRRESTFEPLVDPATFLAAKEIREGARRSDQQLLDDLCKLLETHDTVTHSLLRRTPGVVGPYRYIRRFGSVRAACALVGTPDERDFSHLTVKAKVRTFRLRLAQDIIRGFDRQGMRISCDRGRSFFSVRDGEILLYSLVMPTRLTAAGKRYWNMEIRTKYDFDFLVLARLNDDVTEARDYFIIPERDLPFQYGHIFEDVRPDFALFRVATLDRLFRLGRI